MEIAKPLGRGHGDRHHPLTDKTADRAIVVVQRLLGRIVIENVVIECCQASSCERPCSASAW